MLINQAIAFYLENRREFYQALLPRIPDQRLRNLLKQAIMPVEAASKNTSILLSSSADMAGDALCDALCLTDPFKKGTFGMEYARTVISFEEALERSRRIEEAGVLFFEHLGSEDETSTSVTKQIASFCNVCLINIIKLTDNLRYHKGEFANL
jgi:hypothetical protein